MVLCSNLKNKKINSGLIWSLKANSSYKQHQIKVLQSLVQAFFAPHLVGELF